jgi:hypothetical protein
MSTAETVTATIHTHRLQPGHHISRDIIGRDVIPPQVVTLPRAECLEARPDWGEYSPLVTFRMVERALHARGMLPPLPDRDHAYYVGVQG